MTELTTAAMVDETKHAKSCFAVASHFAGCSVGPGRLVVEKSLDEMSLHEIVLNTIREGCVGETIAAIEAREAAEHAVDPVLRELLLVLSEDELRHAELAFRFVKWALAEAGAALASAVETEFAALAREAAPREAEPALTAIEEVLLCYGVVPGALRRSIRARAIAEVIMPCSRALCDASHGLTSPAAPSMRSVATVAAGSN